jgi:hypothetical protein
VLLPVTASIELLIQTEIRAPADAIILRTWNSTEIHDKQQIITRYTAMKILE